MSLNYSILYALVARGNVILAEYSFVQGNASIVALQILEKITASEGDRMSYLADDHVFHVRVSEGIVYMAMATQPFPRRAAFAFLEDIRMSFLAAHGATVTSAPAYAFNNEFCSVLRDRATFFSDPRSDTITRVQSEVDSLRNTMVQNIDNVLERGERLELLVNRTDGLAENTFLFKRDAGTLKRRMWWRNARTNVCVVAIAITGLYILAATVCGPTLQCSK